MRMERKEKEGKKRKEERKDRKEKVGKKERDETV